MTDLSVAEQVEQIEGEEGDSAVFAAHFEIARKELIDSIAKLLDAGFLNTSIIAATIACYSDLLVQSGFGDETKPIPLEELLKANDKVARGTPARIEALYAEVLKQVQERAGK